MKLYKNIPIKNIYYMLAYAYNDLLEQDIVFVEKEEFDNIQELMAHLLIKGVEYQIKKGLFKSYEYISEELYTVRGRIDIIRTMSKNGFRNARYVCGHDEYTTDTLMNRIIKSVMLLLINADIKDSEKEALCRLVRYFSDVSAAELSNINWNNFNYNRNNKSYRFLMSICRVICENMLFTTEDGELKIIEISEKNENLLYEKFILNYFRTHYDDLHPEAPEIKWAVTEKYSLMPKMLSDVVLCNDNKKLIIDAKFYKDTTVSKTEDSQGKIHSHNLYQIFTYVKNEACHFDGEVSGMLLYARTREDKIPADGISIDIGGSRFYVRSLDLSVKFDDIAAQLNEIAKILCDS